MTSDRPHESGPPADANLSKDQQRLLDLLADDALGTLAPAETSEMQALLEAHPELHSDEAAALEEAVALLAVAETPDGDVPASLRRRLDNDAQRFFAEGADDSGLVFPSPVVPDKRSSSQVVLAFTGGIVLGGLAAAVLFALLSSPNISPLPRPAPPGDGSNVRVAGPDQLHTRWIQDTPGVVEHVWTIRHPGYEKVNGKVAWSGRAQAGYMVLENLPANDPGVTQYQLWIVDPTRDEFPVDGGVFDVAPYLADDGRAYVPIDAKLPVNRPAAFALTLEQPGGVVKSKNPLLVVAPVPAS